MDTTLVVWCVRSLEPVIYLASGLYFRKPSCGFLLSFKHISSFQLLVSVSVYHAFYNSPTVCQETWVWGIFESHVQMILSMIYTMNKYYLTCHRSIFEWLQFREVKQNFDQIVALTVSPLTSNFVSLNKGFVSQNTFSPFIFLCINLYFSKLTEITNILF